MEEAEFLALADATLADYMGRLDRMLGDVVDVDLDGGVLTIELENDSQYVLNKHAPTRQLWLSSPVSGAGHFRYDPGLRAWIDTRSGSALADLLERELAAAAGRPIKLA